MKIIKEEKKEYYELKSINDIIIVCICFHEDYGSKSDIIEWRKGFINNYGELYVNLYYLIEKIYEIDCVSDGYSYIRAFIAKAKKEKWCNILLEDIENALNCLLEIYKICGSFDCNGVTIHYKNGIVKELAEIPVYKSFYTKKNKQIATIGE